MIHTVIEISRYYLAKLSYWLRGLFQDPLKAFDYFELHVYDVNCIARGRLVERGRLQEVIRRGGMGINAAICYVKADGEPLPAAWFGTRDKPGNVFLRPDLTTLAKAPKARAGADRVAQITCDLVLEAHTTPTWRTISMTNFDHTSPRRVALIQLERLRQQGLKIHYCFEMEFTLLASKDGLPANSGTSWGNMVDLLKTEKMMLEFLGSLTEAGLDCSTLHLETGPSQYEFVLKLATGIKGADMAACFRKEAKVFFESAERHLFPDFRSYSPSVGAFFRTMHLNHFLSKYYTKRDAFNADSGTLQVSDLARRWMEGINRHLPALMALFCPTENCYKRYTDKFVDKLEFFSVNHRRSCLRRKKEGMNVYLENRLPSSFSNPYLVLAGTIAAGLDGIKNCSVRDQKQRPFQMPRLPRSLEGALTMLEQDKLLSDELGSTFVDLFVAMKKNELKEK